jgi:murein DD-endopeptidase MepM/ murein hydrolase activator NlpD
MNPREGFPQAKLSRSHYFVSVSRGDAFHTFAFRPLALWAIGALLPLVAIWAGATSLYIAFHDDMLGVYVARQAEMQNAYEDRVAEARAEVDRVSSRQLLDQNSFEGKMHDLLSRQARLEQHGSIVAALATEAGHDPFAAAAIRARAKNPLDAVNSIEAVSRSAPTDGLMGPAVRAFVPAAPAKPRPVEDTHESVSVIPRSASDRAAADLSAAADNPNLNASARLGLISYSLDRVERGQIAELDEIAKVARGAAHHLNALVARAGLSADALKPPDSTGGVGGPFIPMSIDPQAPAFDQVVARAARDVESADRLRRVMPYLPVRAPLIGEASVSSPFGYRPDPFIGRPALHPGVDLVQPYGADIHATAAGRVVRAGPMGGYGNMVEIDHGNGLATRYGHMSEVLVSEGDDVKAGATLGKIGSTGRSTGPHLHYEVRVDGEAVDPDRFLKAGTGTLAEP